MYSFLIGECKGADMTWVEECLIKPLDSLVLGEMEIKGAYALNGAWLSLGGEMKGFPLKDLG